LTDGDEQQIYRWLLTEEQRRSSGWPVSLKGHSFRSTPGVVLGSITLIEQNDACQLSVSARYIAAGDVRAIMDEVGEALIPV
jgi:hypothetical protein